MRVGRVVAYASGVADSAAPTGALRGAANPGAGGIAPWASFAAQTREHVPELRWPRRNVTYERVLTDAQAFGLYLAMAQPAESYGWWVHPNGNDSGAVAALAEDVGLPVFQGAGEASEAFRLDSGAEGIERVSLPDEFDFGDLLHEALFAPVFGHYFFEFAGELDGRTWRMTDLAPLHPATLAEVRSNRDGSLRDVSQKGAATFAMQGGTLWASGAPRIGPERLVPFVYWPDATQRWLGRSLFRPLYRNWLCKDVLLRVDVTNHEKSGGVPVVRTDNTYAGVDLADLQRLAAEFRVDEEAGAAMPPGAWLELLTAGSSNVIESVRYHDEQMSFVWGSMVRQLGQTPNGSRALGETFDVHEVLARRSVAEWVRKTVNRWVFARWWWWNTGQRNGPVLRFTPPSLEAEVDTPSPTAEPAAPEAAPEAATARAALPSAFSRRFGCSA